MRRSILCLLIAISFSPVLAQQEPAREGEIRLLVRADDMGAAQAVNEACIKSYKDGIVKSVEVIVPGPWFPDAVRLLKEHPDLDVGVHLALTSEWERVKWRPPNFRVASSMIKPYSFDSRSVRAFNSGVAAAANICDET